MVVILIIGILASVAVPQYQNAIEKSKATQAMTLLKSVYQAQESYAMANGRYALTLDDLAISLPKWTANEEWYPCNAGGRSYSNGEWSLRAGCPAANASENRTGYSITIGRLKGKYKGAGFVMHYGAQDSRLVNGKMYCGENKSLDYGVKFEGTLGDYCSQLFGAKNKYPGAIREFLMP